ncbi:TonB-dependent receptor [Thalassotalea nanhaiensis]|uniref:TonB-dependent receptor n=1 Tax=Thalassotalea nanhaiensis TaxID=3065648 RepID=A0ABY9TD57_9GAMM|nr:TonB-dependent receptor [Colwelliaceae bacterium SQ345]
MNFQNTFKATKSSLATAITMALIPTTVFAQTTTDAELDKDLEVIQVVGDFREQNLQKTASSLSVVNSDDIALRNAQNLEEIVLATPNVNFSSGSSRARYYQIRGIGERSQFKEPINPSVGVIIDEVDFTGIGSAASLYDVQQVEVFRGPQGTKFGANAMAGVINITTFDPSDEFEGSVKAMVGNYNSSSLGLMLSGPASDKLGYRLAVEQFQSDGFIENTYLDKEDTNNKDELTVRTKLKYQASDDLTLDMTVFYLDFDNGYDAFSLDNTRNTLSDEPGFDTQETIATSVKATYTGLESIDVVSILSYADSDLGYGYDEDWSNPELCIENDCPWGDYSSTDHYFRDKTTSTQEVRLVSKPDHQIFADTTSWVAGIYHKSESEDLLREYTYNDGDYLSEFEATTIAGFVQFDSSLTNNLTLTTGIRVEDRDADYSNSEGSEFEPSDTMVGGKIVLAYEASANTLVYGSVNRGFKAGGVNSSGSLSDENREFEPEYVMNYELGLKQNYLDGDAYARFAVFYMDRTDMQVSTYAANKRPDGSEEFITYLDNAAEGTNQGIEIDAAWNITDSFEVYGAFGLLDSEYVDFINGNGDDLSGREQAHAPKYQYNVGVNYYVNDQWLVNVNVDGKDEYFFSDTHEEKSDAIDLLNASITYFQDSWQVKLWGRNITDKDYQTRGFYFGNDPRDLYTAKGYYQLAAPAEFGVTLDYQF